jgi:catalase
MASVLYDAVIVPCGPDSVETLSQDGYAVHFVAEAYKHAKPIGAFGAGMDLLRKAGLTDPRFATGEDEVLTDLGVVTSKAAEDSLPDGFFESFAGELAHHRIWSRDTTAIVA